ncbi:hypothetical protein JW960_29380 [candidate division KSB1 bacterium]|nr:hypothetical protein [candidate division KSB1 bacterium]
MSKSLEKIKPVVNKNVLIFLSGLVWIAVGTMLVLLSYTWLHRSPNKHSMQFAEAGVLAAMLIHHFGFLKIVDKNLGRLLPMEGKKCVFSFMTWKSYIMVAVMSTMGALLRQSRVPKPYLSIVYIGIGLSLILSSFRYLRVFIIQFKSTKE